MKVKNLIVTFLFLATWNEYKLVPHAETPQLSEQAWGGDQKNVYFTVEIDTHSVKLATKDDVDLFRGSWQKMCDPTDRRDIHTLRHINRILDEGCTYYWATGWFQLNRNGFNLEVKEVKQ